MENRHGLVVDVETTEATGTAECEAAVRILDRRPRRAKTLGADKGFGTADFVAACRERQVTPHVAAKAQGAALDGRTTRHETDKVSQRIRKRIEEVFGWLKTVGGLRKSRFVGRAKLAGQLLLGCAADNRCAWAASMAGGMRAMSEGVVPLPGAIERMYRPTPN